MTIYDTRLCLHGKSTHPTTTMMKYGPGARDIFWYVIFISIFFIY